MIVCEGFVGNVLLKASEGMADMMLRKVSHEVLQRLDKEKPHAEKAFHDLGKKYSYHESGGALLLGVDGICIICHGSSNGRSIFNALRVAVATQDRQMNPQIIAELAEAPVV